MDVGSTRGLLAGAAQDGDFCGRHCPTPSPCPCTHPRCSSTRGGTRAPSTLVIAAPLSTGPPTPTRASSRAACKRSRTTSAFRSRRARRSGVPSRRCLPHLLRPPPRLAALLALLGRRLPHDVQHDGVDRLRRHQARRARGLVRLFRGDVRLRHCADQRPVSMRAPVRLAVHAGDLPALPVAIASRRTKSTFWTRTSRRVWGGLWYLCIPVATLMRPPAAAGQRVHVRVCLCGRAVVRRHGRRSL